MTKRKIIKYASKIARTHEIFLVDHYDTLDKMLDEYGAEQVKQLEDEKMYLISAIKNAKIEGLLEKYDAWRIKRKREESNV